MLVEYTLRYGTTSRRSNGSIIDFLMPGLRDPGAVGVFREIELGIKSSSVCRLPSAVFVKLPLSHFTICVYKEDIAQLQIRSFTFYSYTTQDF
jgi:hypothetical protein